MRVAHLLLPLITFATLTAPLAAQHRGGSSHVRGYTRHDGTYVHPYTRSAPRSYAAPRARSYSSPRPRSYSAPRTYRAPRGTRQPTYGARDSHRIKRSREARGDFMRRTGYPRGRPGYVIDHVVPLCAGGADAPSNMQWQTVEAAKIKDRQERAECARH